MTYTVFEITLIALSVPGVLVWAAWLFWRQRVPAWARDRLVVAAYEVKSVYLHVRQTYVDNRRDTNGNGRLDDEEKSEAMRMALDELKRTISLEWLAAALARIYRNGAGETTAEAWLERQLEVHAAQDREKRRALEVAEQMRPLSRSGSIAPRSARQAES